LTQSRTFYLTEARQQYGEKQGFYLQGSYTAEQASYSHHARYVYRSADVEGLQADKNGAWHHLLLVKVRPCRQGRALTTASSTLSITRASACQISS